MLTSGGADSEKKLIYFLKIKLYRHECLKALKTTKNSVSRRVSKY